MKTETCPQTADLREALKEARHMILSLECGHGLVCADAKCEAADHDHEGYGEDGWGCEHECECIPACEGYEPETCERATKAREMVDRIETLLHRPAPPPTCRTMDEIRRMVDAVIDASCEWQDEDFATPEERAAEESLTAARASLLAAVERVVGERDSFRNGQEQVQAAYDSLWAANKQRCEERDALSAANTELSSFIKSWQDRLCAAESRLAEAERERDEARNRHFGADRLADEVDVLVRRKVIDFRSPAADALLDYREPPMSPRSDRLLAAESRLAEVERALRGLVNAVNVCEPDSTEERIRQDIAMDAALAAARALVGTGTELSTAAPTQGDAHGEVPEADHRDAGVGRRGVAVREGGGSRGHRGGRQGGGDLRIDRDGEGQDRQDAGAEEVAAPAAPAPESGTDRK